MKIIGVSLGNRRGEFEVRGVADVAHKTAKFQTVLNGVAYFESEDYEECREVMMLGVSINTENKERAN
jgi:hypothetical protein